MIRLFIISFSIIVSTSLFANDFKQCYKTKLLKYPVDTTTPMKDRFTIKYILWERRYKENSCIDFVKCLNLEENKEYFMFVDCMKDK